MAAPRAPGSPGRLKADAPAIRIVPDAQAAGKPRRASITEVAQRLQGKPWAVGRVEDLDRMLGAVLEGRREGPNFTAGDPLDSGWRGGYPQINDGTSPTSSLLPFVRMVYKKSAPARVIVDRFAADQWDEWFELVGGQERFRQAVEAFMKRPTQRTGEKPLWWWFKRSTRLARRDGRALLHFGLIEGNGGGDPAQPPGQNVKGIAYLQIFKQDLIVGKDVGNDPDVPEEYGRVLRWRVRVPDPDPEKAKAGQTVEQDIDAGRVLPFIPEPSEDDIWEGDSPLAMNVNYVQAVENMLFAALQAYAREAEPLLVVYKESTTPGQVMDKDERASLKKEIRKVVEENTERAAFVHGVRVEVIGGEGTLSNPEPHWDIAIQAYMMATGAPRPVITGEVIGELVAAKEASRRWASIISKVQESDGDPLVNILLAFLRKWNVESWVQLPGKDDVQIKWRSLLEEDEQAKATVLKTKWEARAIAADRRMKPDADLDYEVSEDPDMLATYQEAERPAAATPFGGAPAQAVRAEAVTPTGLTTAFVERTAKRLRRVLKPAFEAAAAQAKGARREDAGDPFLDPKMRDALAEAIRDALMDAADQGERDLLARLEADDLRRYLDRSGQAEAFKTIGVGLAPRVADRLAKEVRGLVADELAAGRAPAHVASAIMARFEATRVDAERIARSEAVYAWNRGAQEGMRQAGVQQYQWVAFPDADEGSEDKVCADLDGQVFPVLGGPLPVQDTHPNCRCATIPVLPAVPAAA